MLWQFCRIVLRNRNDILLIDKQNVIDWYSGRVYPTLKQKEYSIISLDESLQGDYRLNVCRITDPRTEKVIGIGSRIGAESLEKQLERIPSGKYWLADEGVFTGDTIITLSNMLKRSRIYIEGVVLGIVTLDAYTKLRERFRSSISCYVTEPIKEWADGRDAIGWDGRVTPNRRLIPYYENPGWLSLPNSCQPELRRIWEETQAILQKYNIKRPWIAK